MTSDQFRKDYRQMTAQGVVFTPDDIVRLNALSVKTQLSATAARDVHLPRLAFLPRDSWWRAPIVLREPTIAHDIWLEMAARWIDVEREDCFLFLYAFALSRHPGRLPDAERPKTVAEEVFAFARKRLYKFTRTQLRSAVDYALYGADWTVGEHGPARSTDPDRGDDRDASGAPPSPTIGLLTECRMMRLPITLDDAMRMTSSELTEAINRAWDQDGKFQPKRAHAKAFGDYVRAREEIRARSIRSNSPQSTRGREP